MSLSQITFSVIFCFLVFFLMSLYYHHRFYLSILFCIFFYIFRFLSCFNVLFCLFVYIFHIIQIIYDCSVKRSAPPVLQECYEVRVMHLHDIFLLRSSVFYIYCSICPHPPVCILFPENFSCIFSFLTHKIKKRNLRTAMLCHRSDRQPKSSSDH